MLALSIPIALQNLITSVLNIFDQLMVGWLPTNADNCLSAVLLANQIVFIYQIILFAACNTAVIFISQYAENKKNRPLR
jgi:Na+-driven multidrug efflux pump